MKKKTLTERLNRYFSAEENAIQVPPIETMQAYNEFPAGSEPQEMPATRAEKARKPVQKRTRHIRRVAMVAACLAIAIAALAVIPASISKPEKPDHTVSAPLESNEGAGGGPANQESETSEHLGASGGEEEPPEGNPSEDDAGFEEVSSESETLDDPNHNGNGMGGGGGESFERYYPDELFNLVVLLYIVTEDEIDAAENKLLAENEYYYNEQLPSLYLFIRELNINKEDFVRAMDEYDPDYYTDEQIEWLFSDADIPTIQAAFKLDTALLYNGRLYNLYELLRLEPSQLREMAGTEEMDAYFAGLDALLEDLERKANALWAVFPYPGNNSFLSLQKRLSGLMNELKDKLEEAGA